MVSRKHGHRCSCWGDASVHSDAAQGAFGGQHVQRLLLTYVERGTERGRVLAPVHALAKAARIAHRAGAAHDGRHLQHGSAHGAYRGWL